LLKEQFNGRGYSQPTTSRSTGKARACSDTLARQQAAKTVKQALKGQGLKPQHIARREIATMAKDYLASHPELIAEAKPIVEQWRKEGFLERRLRVRLVTF
jgi:hypothetical protein